MIHDNQDMKRKSRDFVDVRYGVPVAYWRAILSQRVCIDRRSKPCSPEPSVFAGSPDSIIEASISVYYGEGID